MEEKREDDSAAEQLVFEVNIKDLIRLDRRWKDVWETFVGICTYPKEMGEQQEMEEDIDQAETFNPAFKRCLEDPKPRRDLLEEAYQKVSAKLKGERIGWIWRDGKYTRAHSTFEGNEVAALVGEILVGSENSDHDEETTREKEKGRKRKKNRLRHRGISAEPGTRGNFYYPKGAHRSWHTNW